MQNAHEILQHAGATSVNKSSTRLRKAIADQTETGYTRNGPEMRTAYIAIKLVREWPRSLTWGASATLTRKPWNCCCKFPLS